MCMAGYFPKYFNELETVETVKIIGNTTQIILNDVIVNESAISVQLRKFKYFGPMLMGLGIFIIVVTFVVVLEARDKIMEIRMEQEKSVRLMTPDFYDLIVSDMIRKEQLARDAGNDNLGYEDSEDGQERRKSSWFSFKFRGGSKSPSLTSTSGAIGKALRDIGSSLFAINVDSPTSTLQPIATQPAALSTQNTPHNRRKPGILRSESGPLPIKPQPMKRPGILRSESGPVTLEVPSGPSGKHSDVSGMEASGTGEELERRNSTSSTSTPRRPLEKEGNQMAPVNHTEDNLDMMGMHCVESDSQMSPHNANVGHQMAGSKMQSFRDSGYSDEGVNQWVSEDRSPPISAQPTLETLVSPSKERLSSTSPPLQQDCITVPLLVDRTVSHRKYTTTPPGGFSSDDESPGIAPCQPCGGNSNCQNMEQTSPHRKCYSETVEVLVHQEARTSDEALDMNSASSAAPEIPDLCYDSENSPRKSPRKEFAIPRKNRKYVSEDNDRKRSPRRDVITVKPLNELSANRYVYHNEGYQNEAGQGDGNQSDSSSNA